MDQRVEPNYRKSAVGSLRLVWKYLTTNWTFQQLIMTYAVGAWLTFGWYANAWDCSIVIDVLQSTSCKADKALGLFMMSLLWPITIFFNTAYFLMAPLVWLFS